MPLAIGYVSGSAQSEYRIVFGRMYKIFFYGPDGTN